MNIVLLYTLIIQSILNVKLTISMEVAQNLGSYQEMSSSSYFSAWVIPPQGIPDSSASVPLTVIAENEKVIVSGLAGETTFFYFDLEKYPSHQIPLIQVRLSGGEGNAELYVTYNELISSINSDVTNVAGCSNTDIDDDNEEICHVLYEPGRFYIMVYGETDYEEATLQWSLVTTPWESRQLCVTEDPYKVTSKDRSEIEFWFYIYEWQLDFIAGLDIFAWNDGHKMTVYDPELKCFIENYDARITGKVSRCSYNSTIIREISSSSTSTSIEITASSTTVTDLDSGYVYVQVYPDDFTNILREYDVNVLLRMYFTISWRLYIKYWEVGNIIVYQEPIVLVEWCLIFYSYACINIQGEEYGRCWFIHDCCPPYGDAEPTPQPSFPPFGTLPTLPPQPVVPTLPAPAPIPISIGLPEIPIGANQEEGIKDDQQEQEQEEQERRRRRVRRRTRRRLGKRSGWDTGGSNWNKASNKWGNDDDNDGGNNWNKKVTNKWNNNKWNNNNNNNWNNNNNNWNNNNNNNNWNKWPTPEPPTPTPPPTRPPTSPRPTRPPTTPRPTPPTPTTPFPSFPTIPPPEPQQNCLWVPMYDCYSEQWTIYNFTSEYENDDSLQYPTIHQCISHCTAVYNLQYIFYIGNAFRKEGDLEVTQNIIAYNTLAVNTAQGQHFEEHDMLQPYNKVNQACVTQDDDGNIYLIGSKGRYIDYEFSPDRELPININNDGTTFMQIYKFDAFGQTGQWFVEEKHPLNWLVATTCAYVNGGIFTFGGLIENGDLDNPASPYPIDGVYRYDIESETWSQSPISNLMFPNWGMRADIDKIDGYIYLFGGYAYYNGLIVSSTYSTFDGIDIDLDEAFRDVTINPSLSYNKSLIQVFDYKTNITKYERSFFYSKQVQDILIESEKFEINFWFQYRYVMTRLISTFMECYQRKKIVWSRNITFVANTTNITTCPPEPPTLPPTDSPTLAPTSTPTKKPPTTKPPTTKQPSKTTTTTWVWDNSKGKGKSNANAAIVNNDVGDDDDDDDDDNDHFKPQRPIDNKYYNNNNKDGHDGNDFGLDPKMRNWMIYGGIFGILIFIVLVKLSCDNMESYKTDLQRNYIYGISKNNKPHIDDDDDETDEEEIDDDHHQNDQEIDENQQIQNEIDMDNKQNAKNMYV